MNEIIICILLGIIILLVYYYNLHRYMVVHYNSDKHYIHNYKNLPKTISNRVVISLTTNSERINKIKPIIKSLLDQTVRVDQIVLNIPDNPDNPCKVPEKIKDMVNVFKTMKDYGPHGGKFIPTLLREPDKGTIIILVDDTHIYGHDFVEIMLNEHKLNPEKALYTKHATLLKTDFVDPSVLLSTKKHMDDNWIRNYLNCEKKQINYGENIRSFNYI